MINIGKNTDLFTKLDYLLDDRVGIVGQIKAVPIDSGAPQFFHYAAQPCNTEAFLGQRNFIEAGGASSRRDAAIAKAVGESIERYCAAIYAKDEFVLATYDSAPFRCVAPEEFALYSSVQHRQGNLPYVPFKRNTLTRWTKTIDVSTGDEWHVPVSMVYAPYFYDVAVGEYPISQPISTGLACHCSYNEAAISALCEVIERDAFTITWQAMLPSPPISLDSLSEENRDLIGRFEYAGSSVRILNITVDHGIPSIMSILMHESDELPAFVFSAASHLSPEIAVRKSLEELAHTRRLAAYLQHQRGSPKRKQDIHVKTYTRPTSRCDVNFLFCSDAWIDFKDLPDLLSEKEDDNLQTLCARIQSVGAKALIRDITSPDVRELGLAVVRAVIPSFHPLFMGHDLRALGGWRLWNVPQKLGYQGIQEETGDNPALHPFP